MENTERKYFTDLKVDGKSFLRSEEYASFEKAKKACEILKELEGVEVYLCVKLSTEVEL